jgi:hypothetical protein
LDGVGEAAGVRRRHEKSEIRRHQFRCAASQSRNYRYAVSHRLHEGYRDTLLPPESQIDTGQDNERHLATSVSIEQGLVRNIPEELDAIPELESINKCPDRPLFGSGTGNS